MSLTPSAVDLLAVIGTGAGCIGILLAVLTQLRLRRLRRDLVVLQAGDSGDSFLTAAARQAELVARLRGELAAMERRIRELRADVADAVRHVAVVRYNAFGDMGGRMSFSAALLDDAGDGMVLTAIHGRSETRSYAKGVKAGISDQQLSPEEQQAIGFALRDAQRGKPNRKPDGEQARTVRLPAGHRRADHQQVAGDAAVPVARAGH